MTSSLILIVEDEPVIAALLNRVLRAAGYEVITARCGKDAVELARLHQGAITLLLCDVVLPDLPGREVSRAAGAFCPEMKTLFISGYPLDILIEEGRLTAEMLQNERSFYVAKPFFPEDIREAVNRIFSTEPGGSHARTEARQPAKKQVKVAHARTAY